MGGTKRVDVSKSSGSLHEESVRIYVRERKRLTSMNALLDVWRKEREERAREASMDNEDFAAGVPDLPRNDDDDVVSSHDEEQEIERGACSRRKGLRDRKVEILIFSRFSLLLPPVHNSPLLHLTLYHYIHHVTLFTVLSALDSICPHRVS